MNIKVYSTPTCPYCKMAKEYFRSKGIVFEDIDVSSSPEKAEEMVKLSGQMGVPVIVIGDQIVLGFDQGAIEKALANK